MNYEDAFMHYKDGTATEEEKAFVQDEIAKAKALSSLLDDEALAVTPAPVAEADANEIKAAKKQFKVKYLMIAAVTVAAVLLVVGAILGGVFGSAASQAKSQIVYGRTECTELAKDYLVQFLNDPKMGTPLFTVSREDVKVEEIDSDFHFEANLSDSYYSYKVELEVNGEDYTVNVDTRTGSLIRIHT